MALIIPEGYKNILGSLESTEKAIKAVKDMFQDNLSAQLALLRVTAPMVVLSGTGLNDDLNGVESPVSFPVKDMDGCNAEVVHSLAKWKRIKLAQMAVPQGRGIYTDMNALRPEEELDNIHSIYVDQWDWEKVIGREDRCLDFLKKTVRRIYEAIKVTENKLYVEFPQIEPMLPEDIFFIHSEELLQMYPTLHEAPEEKFVDVLNARIARQNSPTRLQVLRRAAYYSQAALAKESGVGLRMIQQYEQRARDINQASAANLAALARTLGCRIEDLIETL